MNGEKIYIEEVKKSSKINWFGNLTIAYLDKRKEKIYVIKENEYKREAEWRHIEKISQQKAGAYSETFLTIKEILRGENMSPKDCAWLEKFCHENKILLK